MTRKTTKFSFDDDKENVNVDNEEKVEFDVYTEQESIQAKQTDKADGDFEEDEVEEGPRFSKSNARKRSTSLISKTPMQSNLKLK